MLRNTLYIVLAITILATTTGFTFSKHYCGGKMVSISVNKEAEACCDNMGTSSCCHNETEYFQLKVDYVNFVSDVQLEIQDCNILDPVVITLLQSFENADLTANFRNPESPPPIGRSQYLARIQVFLC